MNKSELESILKKARLPEIPGESIEDFPRRVASRLSRHDPPPRRAPGFWPRLAWAFALAACLVIAFAAGHWRNRMETQTAAANDPLASLKLIRETLAMFPNHVRAIVQDEQGLKLVLSDSGSVPASSAIYVRICDGAHCSSFVTFSGQEIQVAGQKVTVLSDPRGEIILTGAQFVWSTTGRTTAANPLKISARNLGPVML
jgi:hypothetical protein